MYFASNPRLVNQIRSGALSPHQAIEELAHEIWQLEGCPQHAALENWLQAERSLREYVNSRDDDIQI